MERQAGLNDGGAKSRVRNSIQNCIGRIGNSATAIFPRAAARLFMAVQIARAAVP